jgi:hypothetical protein
VIYNVFPHTVNPWWLMWAGNQDKYLPILLVLSSFRTPPAFVIGKAALALAYPVPDPNIKCHEALISDKSQQGDSQSPSSPSGSLDTLSGRIDATRSWRTRLDNPISSLPNQQDPYPPRASVRTSLERTPARRNNAVRLRGVSGGGMVETPGWPIA